MKTSKCQLCKKDIPAGRRLCDAHRKSHRAAPSRVAAAPMWARILNSTAPTATGGQAPWAISTADILALRNKSLLSCTGWEFELAADLAPMWNEFMAGQPITSGVTL